MDEFVMSKKRYDGRRMELEVRGGERKGEVGWKWKERWGGNKTY